MPKNGRITVSRFCDLAGLLALGMTLAAPPAAASGKTYCDDPAVIEEWRQGAIQFSDDNDVQLLHAVWLGLCQKVKDGTIELDRAIYLFEEQRREFQEKLRQRERLESLIEPLG